MPATKVTQTVGQRYIIVTLLTHIKARLDLLSGKAIKSVIKIPPLAVTYARNAELSIDMSVRVLPKKRTDFSIILGQELLLWDSLKKAILEGRSERDINRIMDELEDVLNAEKELLKNRPADAALAA